MGAVAVDERLLLIYIAIVSAMRLTTVQLGGLGVIAADLLFPLVLLAFLVRVATGARRIAKSGFYVPAIVYLVALLASAIASDDPRRSLFKGATVGYLVCIAIVTLNVVTTRESMRRAVMAWVVGGAANAVAGILSLVAFYAHLPRIAFFFGAPTAFGSLPPGPYSRLYALMQNYNMACSYLVCAFVMVALARDERWLDRRLGAYLLGALGIVTVFTVSPGIGGLVLAIAFLFFPRSKTAVAVAVLVAIGFIVSTLPEMDVVLREHRFVPSSRINVWEQALHTIQEHPLLGRGVGMEAAR
jgi:hypothetical protein